MTGFYNPDGECLLRGTDWIFKCLRVNISLYQEMSDI